MLVFLPWRRKGKMKWHHQGQTISSISSWKSSHYVGWYIGITSLNKNSVEGQMEQTVKGHSKTLLFSVKKLGYPFWKKHALCMLQFLYSSQHIRTYKKPPLHSDEVKGLLALNRKVQEERKPNYIFNYFFQISYFDIQMIKTVLRGHSPVS